MREEASEVIPLNNAGKAGLKPLVLGPKEAVSNE